MSSELVLNRPDPPPPNADALPAGLTYGRARLLLGITGVGGWVVIASALLVGGVPARLAAATGPTLAPNAAALLVIVTAALAIQAILDLLGGSVVPRRFGRVDGSFGRCASAWARGVAVHGGTTLALALAMLLASRGAGGAGLVVTGIAATVVLLALRRSLAIAVGDLRPGPARPELGHDVAVLDSDDVGFTGSIDGVFRPAALVIPAHWDRRLERDQLDLALERRREAIRSGLWRRGRWTALLFTWAGLAVAAVAVGPLAGTAGGVLAFAAVFTLWSFVGLLILPTLSRRAAHAIDARLIGDGVERERLVALAASLDAMQDGEPDRPAWIESIFHPIPNVTARTASPRPPSLAAWDAARTAAFLSMAGLAPLGRAVHCNCGRPALWVYLPVD